MRSKILAAVLFSIATSTSYAQIIAKKQIDMAGQKMTLVMYSTKCFVAAGEGVKVTFYDAGGNAILSVCRTGGGSEPALFTFDDGSQKPAIF
jgi:hypothetical protein